MLEESVSNHGHERVAVEALPGSPLEVVETQFFFTVAGEPARKSIAP